MATASVRGGGGEFVRFSDIVVPELATNGGDARGLFSFVAPDVCGGKRECLSHFGNCGTAMIFCIYLLLEINLKGINGDCVGLDRNYKNDLAIWQGYSNMALVLATRLGWRRESGESHLEFVVLNQLFDLIGLRARPVV